jgi:glycosyltransferase involved in cell wall biosynthesis
MKPQRVACVISSLAGGGAERMMAWRANKWAEMGRAVSIVTLLPKSADEYELDARIERISLDLPSEPGGKLQALSRNLRRLRSLSTALKRIAPEVIVSAGVQTNVLSVLAARNLPVIAMEPTEPFRHEVGFFWNWTRTKIYPKAAQVVVFNQDVADWAHRYLPSERVSIIPNPIWRSDARPANNTSRPKFDILINAFSMIKHREAWELVIGGEGEERRALLELISKLGLSNSVHLVGKVLDPISFFEASDFVVVPSRREGFSNALTEAMSCGIPAIATDCSGPKSIVRHEVDGLIVPREDTKALADAITRLINDADLRRELGRRAVDVWERFSPESVLEKWERVLESVVK